MSQQIYKYAIDVSLIYMKHSKIEKNKSFSINSRNIIRFSVSNDYRNNLHPISFIQFSLSEKDYAFLVENKDDLRLRVTLTSYLVDNISTLEEYLSNKIPYTKNIVFEKMFKMYFDDISPYNERKLYEEDPLLEDMSEFKVVSMYLFTEEGLNKNKYDVNFVLNDVSVFDSLVYICNKSSVDRLIMKEPDNTEQYDQIMCPPLKLKDSVNFIQEHYGIYKEGVMLYQDFNRTYLLPKSFTGSIVEEDEVDKIFILLNDVDGNTSNMNITSYYSDKYDAFMINVFNNVQIIDNSNFNKEIVGNKLTIINANNIDNDTEEIELPLGTSDSFNINNIDKNKNIVYYNNNKYPIMEYYHDILNNQININIDIMNIDASFITPNKKVVLIFEDSASQEKYGGDYNIKSFIYNIRRDNGGAIDFQLTGQIGLNKVMY